MIKKFRVSVAAGLLAALVFTSVMPVFAAEENVGEVTQEGTALAETEELNETPEPEVITELNETPEAEVTAEPVETPETEMTAEPAETPESGAEAIPESSAEIEAEEEAEEAAETDLEEDLVQASGTPVISYQTHVQTYGWQDYVKDGEMSGTSGQSKRLEAIRIRVDGVEGLGVEYRTHVQTYGWQDYVRDDAMAGTAGESKRLEAINIRLTGDAASEYDVYYCVHVQTFGWLGWAKNGEMAGTAGYSKRLEGIMIRILPKGDAAPSSISGRTISCLYANIEYQTHVQTYGWQNYVSNGAVSGTTGQSKRLEGIRIRLGDCCLPGSVKYRTHIQTYGWEPGYVADDAMSGTTGESKRLEAIEISLDGEIASYFDIYYRTHVQRYGWTDWAVNGEPCGSEGCSYRLEGIQIHIVPKGNPAPGATANKLYTRSAPQNEMISTAQGFYSATDWLILTNVTTHMVGVFHWNGSSWELYKEILSSTGAPWSPTVEGEFIVQSKILYFGTDHYRCWYATQFWGDYLFHSVLYNVESGPYTVQDGRLGMAISQGCVRMDISDAKWIYDNIPSGTKVYVYH